MTPEPLLTPDEVARILRLSRLRVYSLIRTGRLRGVRIGRQVRVAPEELRRVIAEGCAAIQDAQRPTAEA